MIPNYIDYNSNTKNVQKLNSNINYSDYCAILNCFNKLNAKSIRAKLRMRKSAIFNDLKFDSQSLYNAISP